LFQEIRTAAAQVTAELNIRLENPVSTKTDINFTNQTSTVKLQLLYL
jgi:hypothetical protein